MPVESVDPKVADAAKRIEKAIGKLEGLWTLAGMDQTFIKEVRFAQKYDEANEVIQIAYEEVCPDESDEPQMIADLMDKVEKMNREFQQTYRFGFDG